MTGSRKQTRTDLRDELAPLVTSVPSHNFYRYEPQDYLGKSPVVFLRSIGAEHPKVTKTSNSIFLVEAHILTLYADYTNEVYQEEESSDLLDEIEKQIATAVDTKRVVPDKWTDLAIEGRTIIDDQPAGGVLYLHEAVLLRVSLY